MSNLLLKLDTKLTINKDLIDAPNLCDRFSPEDLTRIGEATWTGYDRDVQSRFKWLKRMEAGMDLAMQIQKEKTFPWPGSANVIFPLVTIAALQFSARSYSNIIQGTDVVRYRVIGEDADGSVQKRADRISKHMSWQVLEEDISWEEQHDRLLINLAIVGTNFIKTYFSPALGHNVSELVLARDFVLDYYAKSVEGCARKTQVVPLYRNEIYERVKDKRFYDCLDAEWFVETPAPPDNKTQPDNRQGVTPPPPDEDTPFQTLEQHRLLDLDGDGYAEPYIVTIEEKSHAVLRIVARFDKEEDVERTLDKSIYRIKPTEYFTKYSFIPSPDGGIYDVGFGVLLGPLNEAVNTGINQLLDAGTMSNTAGGFLGRGAKIRGGSYTMSPWEWKRVDSSGDDLRKNMVQFQVREPSNVMFSLLGFIVNYTDRVAGTVDQMVGENPGQNTPAETSRNMTEQGMQVYSMIFKRVWRSMKEEFKKLHSLNATFLRREIKFGTGKDFVRSEDYQGSNDLVVPVADPTITSKAMRFFQAQAIREASHQVNGYDLPTVERNFLRAMGVEGIDRFYPGPDKVPPLPNPKAQIEQLRAQVKGAQIEYDKWEFLQTAGEVRKKLLAEIALMEAEALEMMANMGIKDKEIALKRFDSVVGALKAHADAMNDQMKLMQGDKGGGDSGSGDGGPPAGGAIPNMEVPGGGTGILPNAAGGGAGSNGTMGAG